MSASPSMFHRIIFRQDSSQATFWQTIGPILIVVFFIGLLCWIFAPIWDTNDDVAMSMVAHGYGLATHGSPTLIFSNVLWGYLVRTIPEINGVLGYSIATLAVLLGIGCTTVYFLQRLGVAQYIAIIAVCLILCRAVLFPQFTVNAGLLTVSAILGFWSYARSGGLAILGLATILVFLGYIVRSQECFLVLAIAAPLLPWKQLSKDREFKIALAILILAILFAVLCDQQSYHEDAWRRFYEINAARSPYTDFSMAELLKNHPQILAQYGYSTNDIDLISNFFFVDPQLIKPKSLWAMLAALGPTASLNSHIELGFDSINSLRAIESWPMCLLTMIVFLLRPKLSLFFSIIVFLLTLFFLGLMGRGGVFRVYMPLVILCYFAALVYLYAPCQAFGDAKHLHYLKLRQRIGACLTITIFFFNYLVIEHKAILSTETMYRSQKSMSNFPHKIVATWGSDIPIQFIFPLLAHDRHARDLKMYSFGVFTHAPFSIAYTEQLNGRGFVDRLRSPKGMVMVISPDNMERLRIYCLEHFQTELNDTDLQSSSLINIKHVSCTKKAVLS